MSTQPDTPPVSIPIPRDFPVIYENPDEASFFWQQESTHHSEPLKPLDFHFNARLIFETNNNVYKAYALPLKIYCRHINTYYYYSLVPQFGPPEEMEAQGKESEKRLGIAMTGLGERWEKEWFPEIRDHLAYWEGFNLKDASISDLSEHLDETYRRVWRSWEIHCMLGIPMVLAISLFEEMYQDLFSNAAPFDAYDLLAGFENKSVEGSRALWELSRQALVSPVVHKTLTNTDPADVMARLSDSAEGRAFSDDLNTYLQEYGKRSDRTYLTTPFWIENPAPVIKNLQDYVTQPDKDLNAELKKTGERREERLTEVREKLQGYPQPVVTQFESLLKAAQTANILREEHTHWIDSQVSYHVRQVLTEFGRRMAEAGVIAERDDVFYLIPDELKETIESLPEIDCRERVDERRATEKKFAEQTPPPFLGMMPPGPPPDNPLFRAFFKIGGGPPPAPSEVPGELTGSPGSSGVVKGTAKVVRLLSEADKLNPGDILVTEYTTPSWTPLFASVAAVVTDSGGILSHCAVVAREFGIPAVVGANMATSVIQDGQVIEVDGDAGMVRIISPS